MISKVGSISSMTGFGKAKASAGAISIEIEIKALNHRFFDVGIKLPRLYNHLEIQIRSLLAKRLKRGRVEIMISRCATTRANTALSFDSKTFKDLQEIYRKAKKTFLNRAAIDANVAGKQDFEVFLEIMRRSEVLYKAEDAALIGSEVEALFSALNKALTEVQKMRFQEGRRLAQDLHKRLKNLQRLRERLSKRRLESLNSWRERVLARVEKLSPEVQLDPARLSSEVALMCERVDISEELTRLHSHIEESFNALQQGSGKKLDFLAQELGREFNTIASKAQDAKMQALVVDAKLELEKLREQVQNIC